MQNGEESSAPVENPTKLQSDEVTKQAYRIKVWRHLETNGLAAFPRPVYNRIPNFKGAAEAAAKLAELEVFKNAQTIKVNPDKPQEPVRVLCLENNKTLYVPVPSLQYGYVSRLELPEGETGAAAITKAVSRNGMSTFGKPINIEETVSLDMVVMGSVAVSKDGFRIGKGRGYGDLEFGLLMHLKAVNPSTIVVTTVHDCQVYDTLPEELFGAHDVPIDIIVTPTQVINTSRGGNRPPGILWGLVSSRRLARMPLLGHVRSLDMIAGRDCTLKEVDTDIEDRPSRRTRKSQSEGEGNTTEGEENVRKRRPRRRSHKSKSDGEHIGNTTEGEDRPVRNRRARRRSHKSKSEGEHESSKEVSKPRRPRRPRPQIDFSVKVSNIGPHTRVRDLKRALSERGVKPQFMIWKGFRGFAYLHFYKPGPQKGEGDNASTMNVECVMAALREMSVSGEDDGDKPRLLTVEPAPPRDHAAREPATTPATPATPATTPATPATPALDAVQQ